ncbi:MAG: hypothetical protein D6714_00335 [Bacteroidetes bacterium]|nr:MAG: hypothetical protein D6714_00335 [Bacteroidota bacterium]
MLRDLFNATPLRVPEARVRPMMVIAEKNGKTEFRGGLEHLLVKDAPLEVNIRETMVTDVALEKTKSVDFDFGFEIMKGFFQGFGIPASGVQSALNGAKKISFSFRNVRRLWVDKNELGSRLRGRLIDLEHPSMAPFQGPDPWQMLLISDAIVSNGFAVNVERASGADFEIKLPEIEAVLEDASAKVQVKKGSKNSLSFEGDAFLTFAFCVIQLSVDEAGKLRVGTVFKTRSADGKEIEVVEEEPTHVLLDDNDFEPGLLVFDE